MSEKQWFILLNGQVSGPYLPKDIENQASKNSSSTKIWGRGLGEWVDYTTWFRNLNEGQTTQKNADQHKAIWRMRIEGKETENLTYDDMLNRLRQMTEYKAVDIFTEGSPHWRELYSVQKIVDDLNLTRRSHPRVPIMGTLEGEGPHGEFQARIISISEGGLGITDSKDLHLADKIKATISSPNLFMKISCTCEVVYVGKEGYAGLRFTAIPQDAKSSVIAYVNKFGSVAFKDEEEDH